MSFKLVPFETLGAVSYSPSIVTMAVYEINVKKITFMRYSASKNGVTLKLKVGVVQDH